MTIVKLVGSESVGDELRRLVTELNSRCAPQIEFTPRSRRRPYQWATSLCDGPDWHVHLDSILFFVDHAGEALVDARGLGVDIVVDTAVWVPDDMAGSVYQSVYYEPEFLAEMGRRGVCLMITVYDTYDRELEDNHGDDVRPTR